VALDPPRTLVVGCERDGFGDPPLSDVPAEVEALARVWEAARPGRADAHLVAPDERPEARALPMGAWDRFDVLHFACHGDFPDGRPLDAGLRLGAGVLRAREFFGIRLDARVVALSACAVGRQARRAFGLDLADDEWVGLYLPLFYAGARSLVASQWNANSEQAVPFMTALHAALARGAPPVEAYAAGIAAVRAVPEQLWANWVLVGVPDARAAAPDHDAESDR
jgi:CHAT domain-containing protein